MTLIRIGFTGHRPNRLSERHLKTLRTKLILVFQQIEKKFNFNELRHKFSLVTGMAAGGDLAAIYAARYLGWQLDLLLPFDRNEFCKEFNSADEIKEFQEFLSDASSITEIDLAGFSSSRESSHEVLGNYLLSKADMLVAVWDGKRSRGKGGTADIINNAKYLKLPIILLDVSGKDIEVKLLAPHFSKKDINQF